MNYSYRQGHEDKEELASELGTAYSLQKQDQNPGTGAGTMLLYGFHQYLHGLTRVCVVL